MRARRTTRYTDGISFLNRERAPSGSLRFSGHTHATASSSCSISSAPRPCGRVVGLVGKHLMHMRPTIPGGGHTFVAQKRAWLTALPPRQPQQLRFYPVVGSVKRSTGDAPCRSGASLRSGGRRILALRHAAATRVIEKGTTYVLRTSL